MSYIGNSPGVASQRVTTTLTATAGQTQFTTQSGYVLGYVDVYLNGAKLVNGSDFEAITGTYITLFAGAAAGDVVELVSYVPRGLSDGYTKAEADAKFLDVGGDTASGSLALATASLSGALTLSGGTAGGVGYLNSSKVVTTDSGLTFDGNALTLGGTAPLIRANMSGTQSTRLGIQNSTANGNTRFFLYPNGTGNISAINGWNNSNPSATDYQAFDLGVISTIDVRLSSSASGSASYLPLTFWNGGSERVRIDSTGNFKLNGGYMSFGDNGYIRADSAGWLQLQGGTSGTRFMNSSNGAAYATLDNSGNFQIGTTVGGAKFLIGTAETKSQNATPFSITTNDTSNRFDLIIARNTNQFYSFQSVEQNVAYRDLVFQKDGGKVGIGTYTPQSVLDVYNATANSKAAYISSLASYTAEHGPTLVLRNGTNGGEELAGIKGGFELSSQGNYGFLSLLTRTSDALGITEKLRITSGGNVGIGQTSPAEKLDVNGNIYIHTASGNPYLKIKTDGTGNNPTIRMQANTAYWDIQTTFSNTHDDLQFLYNGTNKLAFSNNSIGGLSISNGNNQYGRLTVDTDGHQQVVRGGSLNGGDYYYRFLKLFKLKTGVNTGSSTEVHGRLHLSRVNEIGVSAMVDFYASQGYSGQIRAWYKRINGPDGTNNFRFVTLVDGGNTYLCLEFISAPGWHNWQFQGATIDYDGGRGSFAVTDLENLTVKEVGPWNTPISDPSTALLSDSTYGPLVIGGYSFNYVPSGTNTVVATTHVFGAPNSAGGYGEAARINSSGYLLLGTTVSSGAQLQLRRNATLTSHAGSNIQIDSYEADYYTTLHLGAYDSYDIGYIQTAAKNQSWSTKSLSLQPNGGNVGIGTNANANNTSKLTVWGDTQLYAGSSGNSPSLVFGAETGGPKKAIFLNTFWLTIQGHNNEGIRLQTVDASGNATVRMTVAGSGAVTIPGSLSKGSGSFRIPHPLEAKTETHELVHSFIEGPQADLIYRGKVTLVGGQATVNIDTAAGMTSGTFEVLCRDVQCFTTNETGWTAIKGKVVGNILTIQAQDQTCTDEISWMVIGERKDQHMMDTDWTDENGKVIVEPLKPVIETQGDNP